MLPLKFAGGYHKAYSGDAVTEFGFVEQLKTVDNLPTALGIIHTWVHANKTFDGLE